MSSPDFDLVAAELRADATDLAAYVEALAEKLQGALPGRTEVERERKLRGPKRVRRIEVSLDDRRFSLERDGDRIDTRCAHVVRDVALKNEELELEEWLDRLAQDLVAHASSSERGREALERLLAK